MVSRTLWKTTPVEVTSGELAEVILAIDQISLPLKKIERRPERNAAIICRVFVSLLTTLRPVPPAPVNAGHTIPFPFEDFR